MSFSATFLLAVVATLGYLFGRQRQDAQRSRTQARQEIDRALAVAHELEAIAYRLRKNIAFHVPSIVKFSTQLKRWEQMPDVSRHALCERADDLLKPAVRLSTEISHAYADLLTQMTQLSAFAELRSDPLTGISNRRAFDDSLETLLAARRNDEAPLSIILVDLDHFKQINDEQGHLAGDRTLQDLAQLFKAGLRQGDVLARFGGEEFVVLLPRTPLSAALSLAERMRARVEEKLPATVSIGVAVATPDESGTSLLSRSDTALYAAKGEGRNCVCWHDAAAGRVEAVRRSSPPRADVPPEDRQEASNDGPLALPVDEVATLSVYRGEAC